jgi:thymidine phosphorylase
MHLAEEIILKKREGGALSASEIGCFVSGVTDGKVSDAQIAAFAMATWFRGMELEEQIALTLAMRDSGEVLSWPELDGPVLDKHSTGGVGDLVSLVLGPVVASCGAYVPMISGRGLGHTGGTLDKLESIPGFHVSPGIQQFQRMVRKQGLGIIGQTDELAPADRRIYAVRDVTATVSSVPLIVSSILSKKLAEGLDALVMDIKYGSGSFQANPEQARELALQISRVASHAGVPCTALITCMNAPLALSAGNALEVHEAIRFLRGDVRHERLLSVVLALSAELLHLGGLAEDLEAGSRLAADSLDSGRAAERFEMMVTGQGGPADILQKPDIYLKAASLVRPVFSDQPGFVTAIDTRAVGTAVVQLGGGRRCAGDCIDPSVGFSSISTLGQPVDQHTPLAVIHAADEAAWAQAAGQIRAAMKVEPKAIAVSPVIHARVEGNH